MAITIKPTGTQQNKEKAPAASTAVGAKMFLMAYFRAGKLFSGYSALYNSISRVFVFPGMTSATAEK